jgi:hypothetical protein
MNEGRKLSLIIKEYFKLKGNGKMSVDFLVWWSCVTRRPE